MLFGKLLLNREVAIGQPCCPSIRRLGTGPSCSECCVCPPPKKTTVPLKPAHPPATRTNTPPAHKADTSLSHILLTPHIMKCLGLSEASFDDRCHCPCPASGLWLKGSGPPLLLPACPFLAMQHPTASLSPYLWLQLAAPLSSLLKRGHLSILKPASKGSLPAPGLSNELSLFSLQAI